MKTFLFKTGYLVSSPFVEGNWAKLFMSMEEIERKKNEDRPRVFVRIEQIRDAKPRHIKKDLKKLLGRKCKYVSDHINGVRVNSFFSEYGKDISYISTKLDPEWNRITVALVGGLSEELLELFNDDEFLMMDALIIRPYNGQGAEYNPLNVYSRLVRNAYKHMVFAVFQPDAPKVCENCGRGPDFEVDSHWDDGDFNFNYDFECGECSHKISTAPEHLAESDTSGMLEALEAHRIEFDKVFLEINPNAK